MAPILGHRDTLGTRDGGPDASPTRIDTTEADGGDADGTELTLSERVDEVEKALGVALATYRRTAEQVLAKHLDALERSENAQQLEVASLRAENGLLRERLSLTDLAHGGQTVMFQEGNAMPAEQPRGNVAPRLRQEKTKMLGSKSPTRTFTSKTDSDDNGRILNIRRGRDQDKNSKPGGTWQQFVAWVPNGAALKSPEPWKPLPQQQVQILSPAGAPQTNAQAANAGAAFHGVVPGSVADTDPESAETSSSHSSQEAKCTLEVLDVWKASKHALDKLRKTRDSAEGESRYTREQSLGSTDDEEQNVFEEDTPRGLIIHPHSRKRIGWDLASLIMVVYDMIMIPMFVFQLEESFFLLFMEWTTRLFWTIDMGWSCCTGVVMSDGKVEFSFRYIVKRYLKTWFLLDLFIVSSDWIMAGLASSNDMGFTRLARSFRIVRVVRLLRLVRMQEIVAQITERIQSDKLSFILSILKLLIFVVSISHLNACIWWGIGSLDSYTSTWVDLTPYGQASVSTKYMVSLHWALAQFTGGMDEIAPVSPLERFYAVVVWIFAFMAASIIVSILTSNLTQLHIIGGSQSRQMATLRKYLNQNHVSSNLALRVQRSAQHAVSGDLTQDTVELLQVVSEPLKVEMHFNMYSSVLRSHPFFCDYIGEGPQVMRRVCHYAMSTLLLANGDVVFSRGDVLPEPKMYFIWKGACEYVCGYGEGTPVTEKHWVAEANLWTRWKHRGTLTATNDAKLALLDAKLFQDIVRRYKDVGNFDPKLYAADFVAHMNQAEDLDDLTSLCTR